MSAQVHLKQLLASGAAVNDVLTFNGTIWTFTDAPRLSSLGVGVAPPSAAGRVAANEYGSADHHKRSSSTEVFVNTTLNDDNELYLELRYTGSYAFAAWVPLTGNSTDDFKFSCASDGTLVASAAEFAYRCWDNGSTAYTSTGAATSLGASLTGVLTSSGKHYVSVKGSATVSTPGQMRMQWAKATDVAGDLTRGIGGWIKGWRIDT